MNLPAMRLGAAVCLLYGITAPTLPAAETISAQGEYLFRAAGCAHCHTDDKNKGVPLAGGRALSTPFGIFYTTNITPDPETGIGRWSEADFMRALREGLSPEGKHYYPAFPYTSYTRLRDDDLRALWKYLAGRSPVHQANKPHDIPWYLRARAAIGIWKALHFKPGPLPPQTDKSPTWNRGAYLVTAVAHCGECHTPRNLLGGIKTDRELSGNPHGVDDTDIPNITPDKKTGIGGWSESDIAYYLETGMTPDGDFAGDAMAEIIDHSTSRLTPDDRRAIAVYLKSLPPRETTKHAHDHATKRPEKQKEIWE